MQPAPTSAMPASRAIARSCSRTPSPWALPKTTAPRAPTCGSRLELVDQAAVAHAEQHQVGGFVDRGQRSGRHGRPATSAYDGLTSQTCSYPGDRSTSSTIRWPRLPGRGLAPTTATLRASSIARRESAWFRDRRPRRPPQPAATSAQPLPQGPAVPDRGLGGLPAGDAADAAATVGGRAGVVEAGDGRAVVGVAGRGPHVEQLLGRQLAVEDVAADQAVLLLHLVRADDVAVGDRRREAGRHLVVEVDQPVGVRLELVGVRRLAPLVRDVLGEQREDVRPVGVEGLVERRRDHAVAERHSAARPSRASWKARSMNSMTATSPPSRCGARPATSRRARVGREVRQLGERQVDLDHAGAGVPALDVGDEVLGQLGAGEVLEEGDLRVQGAIRNLRLPGRR